jgi:hypothetical protein
MKARTVITGGLAALALSGCTGQGNAATTPATPTPGSSGNYLPFYGSQLQQPLATDICHPQTAEQLLVPCDEGGRR